MSSVAMRLHQFKDALVKLVIIGLSFYIMLYLFEDDADDTQLSAKYEDYKAKFRMKSMSENQPGTVDKLAQTMAKRLQDNEKGRRETENKEGLPDIGKEAPEELHKLGELPTSVIDTMLNQIPGGKDSLLKNDPVATQKLQSLLKDYTKRFASQQGMPNIANVFAKHMFDNQKMMGAMPDIRNQPPFFDPDRQTWDKNANLPGMEGLEEMKRKFDERVRLLKSDAQNPSDNEAEAAQQNPPENDVQNDPMINLLSNMNGNYPPDILQKLQNLQNENPGLFDQLHKMKQAVQHGEPPNLSQLGNMAQQLHGINPDTNLKRMAQLMNSNGGSQVGGVPGQSIQSNVQGGGQGLHPVDNPINNAPYIPHQFQQVGQNGAAHPYLGANPPAPNGNGNLQNLKNLFNQQFPGQNPLLGNLLQNQGQENPLQHLLNQQNNLNANQNNPPQFQNTNFAPNMGGNPNFGNMPGFLGGNGGYGGSENQNMQGQFPLGNFQMDQNGNGGQETGLAPMQQQGGNQFNIQQNARMMDENNRDPVPQIHNYQQAPGMQAPNQFDNRVTPLDIQREKYDNVAPRDGAMQPMARVQDGEGQQPHAQYARFDPQNLGPQQPVQDGRFNPQNVNAQQPVQDGRFNPYNAGAQKSVQDGSFNLQNVGAQQPVQDGRFNPYNAGVQQPVLNGRFDSQNGGVQLPVQDGRFDSQNGGYNPAQGSNNFNGPRPGSVIDINQHNGGSQQLQVQPQGDGNVPMANPMQGEEEKKESDSREEEERRSDSRQERKKADESRDQDEGRRERNLLELKQGETGEIYMSDQEFENLIDEQDGGTTKMSNVNMTNIRIVLVDKDVGSDKEETKVMTVQEYKKWKPINYIKRKANPVKKSDVKPTLRPYPDSIPRPNPKNLVKDLTMTVDDVSVQDHLAKERTRRMALGDDDIRQIPEVQNIIKKAGDGIPNLIHFIWFSYHKYRIHHFMSMKSALDNHDPELILFHTNSTPNGTLWDHFKKMAGAKLRIVKRSPPHQIFGHDITKVEHQSDVTRLEILLEVGGIYMDDDIIVLKSLTPLLNESMVLGEENYDALANSIIMANKDTWFLRRWFQEYQGFNGSQWSYSSCFVPWSLWLIFPNTIHVVKEKMLRPNWEEIKYIYHELWDWSESYTIHLYSRFLQHMDGTQERSLRELSILNTTYGEISRYVLWGSKEPRDITDFF